MRHIDVTRMFAKIIQNSLQGFCPSQYIYSHQRKNKGKHSKTWKASQIDIIFAKVVEP